MNEKSVDRKKLTPEHKRALAEGRREGAVVRRYLNALIETRPKRGRKPDLDRAKARLDEVLAAIPSAPPVQRLSLIQERRDLEKTLSRTEADVDLSSLEEAFVEVARRYAERKGISYGTFRECGVPAEVLKRAGMTAGSKSADENIAA